MNTKNFEQAVTAEKLSALKEKLNIPIYQRLFVWEESQIEQLLADLKEASETKEPYYIGIITIVENGKKPKQDDDGIIWDIVDGQQRLTFLTLFGAYMYSRKDVTAEKWRAFIFAGQEKNDLRINYFGRPEDRKDLSLIVEKDYSEVQNPNFRKFLEIIERREADEEFSCYVYEKVSFLISELPGNYTSIDLNRFFEKMNAAGRQLTPVEQVKGKYFPVKAELFDRCLNFEKRYTNGICTENNSVARKLIDILNDDSNPQIPSEPVAETGVERYSNRSILRPAILLLHVLKITSGENISLDESKLLETFFKWDFDRNKFIENMVAYRVWLDANIIYLTRSDDNAFEYAFRKDDNSDQEESSDERKLRQYQAMLYVSSTSSQEWVIDSYQTKQPLSLDNLKRWDAEKRHVMPERKHMTYHTINRYWFWKLDYILWEMVENEIIVKEAEPYKLDEKEIAAIKNYTFRANRSIEHLHPQTSADKWDDTYLHSFGNLAIISASFNSTQSNESVGVKFARLSDTQIPQRKLESIKMLLMFKLADKKEDGWKPPKAMDHENEMLKLLSNYGQVVENDSVCQ